MPISSVLAKGLFAIIPDMLKDNKGKWSSKRTVSGVLAIACVTQIDANGFMLLSIRKKITILKP